MYARSFGLTQEPFSIAPDPRYLFMSERHREALAHLVYGLRGGGGFVLLTGEIGAGKTTVCRCFLEQIPKNCNVAYIFNPKLTVTELLKSVCDEFHIEAQPAGPGAPTVKAYLDPLNDFLLKAHALGQNNILIIDEAQNLSAEVLEQLRLLTNLETNERKLLQIVLIGQPELRKMLERPELEQLAQRVIARFHLGALSEAETLQYIRHRLRVAGASGPMPFDREARKRIFELSRGVPRRINLLCDRALLGAYATGKARVSRAIVEKAAGEVFGDARSALLRRLRDRRTVTIGGGVIATAALLGVAAVAIDGGAWRQVPDSASVGLAASAPAPAAPVAVASAPGPRPLTRAAAASAPPSVVAPTASATRPPATTTAAPTIAPPQAASAPAFLAATELQTRFKSVTRSEREAWRELAPLWSLSVGEADPCQAAQRSQVLCFKTSDGTLALIRQLDRPGILTLQDDNERQVYALLVGLTPHSARLRMGGVTQTVTLVSLARMWRGDFATFWRAPPGYANTIADGNSGPAVEWLAVQLTKLDGEAVPTDKRSRDATLRAKITEFQLAHGIKADGLAGPATFMQLNRAVGIEEPRLQGEK